MASKVHNVATGQRRCVPRNRTVVSNYPHGYGLLAVQPRPRSSFGPDKTQRSRCLDDVYYKRQMEIKRIEEIDRYIEFENKTQRRMLYSEVKRRVETGLEVAARDVDERRRRLHELLKKEEENWQREIVVIAQCSTNKKWDEMRERAENLRKKRECDRLELVREKREQQWREQCHELRSTYSKDLARQTLQGQIDQRRMRTAMAEKTRAEDKMWAAVQLKVDEARMAREEEDERRRFRIAIEAAEDIDRQRRNVEASKNIEDVENQRLKSFFQQEKVEHEIENKRAAELEKAKKLQTKRDLERQIETQQNRERLEDKVNREVNKNIIETATLDVNKEIEAHQQRKKELKEEVQLHREYLESVKEHKRVKDADLEKDIQDYMNITKEKEDQKKLRETAARVALREKTLIGRREQVIEKEIERAKEREQKVVDRFAVEKEDKMAMIKMIEEQTQRRIKEAEYRRDLDGQYNYNSLLRDRVKEESTRELSEYLRAEKIYCEQLKEMSSRPVPGKVHPLRTALQTLMASAGASGST